MADINLGLRKTKQRIRLDGSDESPVLVLDLGAKGLMAKGRKFQQRYAKQYEPVLKALEEGSEDQELYDKAAAFEKDTIDTFCGKGSYDAVIAYITDGEGAEAGDTIMAVLPLVVHIANEIFETMRIDEDKAVLKYARAHNGTAEAI